MSELHDVDRRLAPCRTVAMATCAAVEAAGCRAGVRVAFTAAGAYDAVMSSTYNSRLLVPEVLVAGDRFAVIRPRPLARLR